MLEMWLFIFNKVKVSVEYYLFVRYTSKWNFW